jgi:hypothetical protein
MHFYGAAEAKKSAGKACDASRSGGYEQGLGGPEQHGQRSF